MQLKPTLKISYSNVRSSSNRRPHETRNGVYSEASNETKNADHSTAHCYAYCKTPLWTLSPPAVWWEFLTGLLFLHFKTLPLDSYVTFVNTGAPLTAQR